MLHAKPMRDIFFNTSVLTLKDKEKLLIRAKELCSHYHIDILDCSVSWARQRSDLSFEDMLKKLDKDTHFVVIHRSYRPLREEEGEIGIATMEDPGYYLFIYLTVENLYKVVTEFKL